MDSSGDQSRLMLLDSKRDRMTANRDRLPVGAPVGALKGSNLRRYVGADVSFASTDLDDNLHAAVYHGYQVLKIVTTAVVIVSSASECLELGRKVVDGRDDTSMKAAIDTRRAEAIAGRYHRLLNPRIVSSVGMTSMIRSPPAARRRTLAGVFPKAQCSETLRQACVGSVRNDLGDDVDVLGWADPLGCGIRDEQTGGASADKHQVLEERFEQSNRGFEQHPVRVDHIVAVGESVRLWRASVPGPGLLAPRR
jgi:hypothetical protein